MRENKIVLYMTSFCRGSSYSMKQVLIMLYAAATVASRETPKIYSVSESTGLLRVGVGLKLGLHQHLHIHV